MPYRRLPNTDLARIYALKKAAEMEGYRENGELVLSYRTTQDTQQLLNKFYRAQKKYESCHELHLQSSKTYRPELNKAKMYVSHFLQVLIMTIQRGELRKDIKTAYGLSANTDTLPDLNAEQAVQEWGERIIKAEEERVQKGGVPIYNPTIAKVKVHWNIFSEHYFMHRQLRQNAENALEEVSMMRPLADDLILDIWNQVETFYSNLPTEDKVKKCKQFGIIYYYRSKELAKKKATASQSFIDF